MCAFNFNDVLGVGLCGRLPCRSIVRRQTLVCTHGFLLYEIISKDVNGFAAPALAYDVSALVQASTNVRVNAQLFVHAFAIHVLNCNADAPVWSFHIVKVLAPSGT